MRLEPEEIKEITKHLISVLKRKRFNIKVDKYGNISYAEKFGIRCCPAILNSIEDGRHGYAYINLSTNPYSEKDLGSYYKPRTNKSKHKMFSTNNSIDKYAGNDVHIDMHNYKNVIETFVDNLNKDYKRIVSKRESVTESAVTIKNTGTVFDGMTGEIESEDENSVTVWLDLNGHKVRNNFKKENTDLQEGDSDMEKPITEDNELTPTDDDLELIEFDDEKAFALTQYLDREDEPCMIVRAYPEDNYGYNSCVYENTEDNSQYLVCTRDEAEMLAKEDLQSLIDDIGAVEAFGDWALDYLDEEYFDDMLREDMEDWVYNNMSDDELIDEMESHELIDEDDKIQDPDWEPDPDDPEEEPEMIYPNDLIESKKDELIEKKIDAYNNGIEWFEEIYGQREMNDFVKDHPEAIDEESLIDNILSNDGYSRLASYDGDELELEYEDEFGRTQYLYAYRIN